MPRTTKKAPLKCNSHQFLLKPISEYVRSPHHLSLSCCVQHPDRRAQSAKPPSSCFQAPTFNRDASHATPAFVLPIDMDYYRVRHAEMLQEHDVRFAHFTDEKTELQVPKPRTKNSFCNVCRLYYEDYLDHISSLMHKRKIGGNVFSRYIQELSAGFQKEVRKDSKREGKKDSKKEGKKDSKKEGKKESKSLKPDQQNSARTLPHPLDQAEAEESDEVEIVSNPYKKVKPNEDNPEARGVEYDYVGSGLAVQPVYWKSGSGSVQLPSTLPFNFNMNVFMSPFNYMQAMPGHGQQLGYQYFPVMSLVPASGMHLDGVGLLMER